MDWQYILSVNMDELDDEQKDELYKAVTWFEYDAEEVDLKKCKALLRVSQEVLKYKGEQVETLIHELEEVEVKRREEQTARRTSDAEARSSRSRSTIEYENLEIKYFELKVKYKKIVRVNEKNNIEINKLNNKIKNLERENERLQNEIQAKSHDTESESDLSETAREQHRELMETVQVKNKHISKLLQDIEVVERENHVLRDKLSSVRDELAVATKEISTMTDILKAKEAIIEENEESLRRMTAQYEILHEEFEELQQTKSNMEQEMREFAVEIDVRVDQWKKILDQKDVEIKDLKARAQQPSLNSSLSSLPNDDLERSQVNALRKALAERENQLLELQTQLQVATKEMEENTEILKILKGERDRDVARIKELGETVKSLKKQSNSVHERCQSLQEEITHAEKTAASKEAELKGILGKMKENGQVDLVLQIEEIQELKSQNLLQEKQLEHQVRIIQKLQETCEVLEKENEFLRDKLGMSEDEEIPINGYVTRKPKHKKQLDALKKRLAKMEEERLSLKSEIQKLTRTVSSLTDQVLELGEKPARGDVKEEKSITSALKNENKALVEENEGLRKGMHEILNSINTKKGSSLSEIKSETFEKLLRALDVKHISGWYHPAMRLQAELHNLEGVNAELREQLREARMELDKYKSIEERTKGAYERRGEESKAGCEEVRVASKEESALQLACEGFVANVEALIKRMKEPGFGSEKELVPIQKELVVVFEGLVNERVKLQGMLAEKDESLKTIQDKFEVAEMKLKTLTGNETDQDKVKKLDDIVADNVLWKRKATYLEEESNKLNTIIANIKNEMSNIQKVYIENLGELTRENKTLENNLKMSRNQNEASVDYELFKEVQKALDEATIKYREVSLDIKRVTEEKRTELKMLQESREVCEKEKAELKQMLTKALSKLSLEAVQDVDDKLEKLSQKLAESEVNEITERQRANHTNNLYELVKEQLNKSEERFQEYSKYNEDILKKNLVLQEQLKEAQDNLCNCVDTATYNKLQKTNNDLLKQNGELEMLRSKLEDDLKLAKESYNNQTMWSSCKEQELLHLRHQIVDLISVSDEKMIIAQLNSDLLHCRQSESFYRTRLEEAETGLKLTKEKLQSNSVKFNQEQLEIEEKVSQLKHKIGVLQNLLSKQKQQYLGSVPLCSEEIYLNNLRTINREKHQSFLHLHNAKRLETEAEIRKEQLEIELDSLKLQKQVVSEGDKEEFKKVQNWIQEKKALQINELRYKRQAEFKEAQLQHFMERVKIQDEQIARLDEELLQCHKSLDINLSPKQAPPAEEVALKPPGPVTKSVEIQTTSITSNEPVQTTSNSKSELVQARETVEEKERSLNQLKSKVTELEMTISLFRKQIGDKQSQITFYERHIMELQSKKEEVQANGAGGDNPTVGVEASKSNEEILSLKATVKALQENLKSKEEEIIKYQTLLKVDRDKHSLAAARLQEELQTLQKALGDEKQRCLSLEETFSKSRPNRAALEQYMTQVHALEKHAAELHTKITSLEAQLHSSRQEAVRWRALANDRLDAMEELRNKLEEQHKSELSVYKTDSEKLKELDNDEKNSLKQLVMKHRSESSGQLVADIARIIKEKDDKIHELTIRLRQTKNEVKRVPAMEKLDSSLTPRINDLESALEALAKENELLKKRYEQVLNRERSARDEIRDLKTQLLKKPSTARSDKSEKSIKDQLQKKVTALENEVVELKQSLAEQISINEGHRLQTSEDFDKWKKMKHWQQTAEKLKNKLKERDNDFEKLQQTCSGYRLLIERLEREKHNLENRVKNLKSVNVSAVGVRETEVLRIENMRLQTEIETLSSKLEMQQHHAGGLGAVMMQEKLEGQERKIAVLELAAKGSVEVRNELERLQDAVTNLQKSNLCLEAENLDLKLDLEKSNKEQPHLQQQIQHLESYIDVLKNENAKKELEGLPSAQATHSESKRVSELERTVFILKRVVEKLQAENKRLVTGKRPLSDRSLSGDKLKRDYARMKEQYTEAVQKIALLERQLAVKTDQHNSSGVHELAAVKEQLEQKSHLLDKVKVLLHKAATKEKALLQEISELKRQRDAAGISPIPEEESEDSSDL